MTIRGVILNVDGSPLSGSDSQVIARPQGAFSGSSSLVMHQETHDSLSASSGPIEVSVRVPYELGDDIIDETQVFSKLYLMLHDANVRDHRPRWVVVDRRWHLSRLWVFRDFSMRRQVNEFLDIQQGPLKQFARTPKLAYIPHTQASASSTPLDPKFSSADSVEDGGRPWTALQAAIYLLQDWIRTRPFQVWPDLPKGAAPRINVEVVDNGHRLVGFRASALWPYVMTNFLRKAHAGLDVLQDGTFRIFSLDPMDLEGFGGYQGSPRLVKRDMSRIRSKRRRVIIRKEQEVRFDFLEEPSVGVVGSSSVVRLGPRNLARNLRNVLILPHDIKSKTGKLWKRGTIISIEKALDLYQNDPINPPPAVWSKNGKGKVALKFSLSWVRKFIMSSALATQMTFQGRVNRAKDSLFQARASSIYNSYRQLYQIPLAWLDFIDKVRVERTGIVDQVTGRRAIANVYMDHFVEYAARHFGKLGASSVAKLAAGKNVYAWDGALQNETDFEKLPLDIAQAGLWRVSWVNKRQGVFRINAAPDLYADTERRIPSLFSKIPMAAPSFGGALWEMQQMEFDPTFRMSLILTLTLRTPGSRFHVVDLGPSGGGAALGPVSESFFGMTHAGFEWIDRKQKDQNGGSPSKVDIEPGTGFLKVTGGRLVNPRVVQDAAKAVGDLVEFDTLDRWAGSTKHPGDVGGPSGQVASTDLNITGGKIESAIDASAPPATPPIWEFLPPSTQAFLFRLEGTPAP